MGSVLEKNSSAVRKRIEKHSFENEDGEEYDASKYGGFGDYMRRKKLKLQNLDAEMRASSTDKPQIFKGVVAHVMGYTQPPLQVLHKELVQHGAGFLQYLDSKTMATHIIASALPPKKVVDYNKYRMVQPQWVTESIAAGKMLPWTEYRVIEEGPRQKTIKFDSGKLASQAKTPQPQHRYKDQTKDSFYTQQLRGSAGGSSGKRAQDTGSQFHTPLARKSKPLQTPGGVEDAMQIDAPTKPLPETCISDSLESNKVESQPEFQTPPLLNVSMNSIGGIGGDCLPPPKEPTPKQHRPPPQDKNEMTSEEHNAMLLSDPKIRNQSCANPNFLKQFYSESRLHHLSTWKAELKSKMQRLANESRPKQKPQGPPSKRKPARRRYVMHVDFDSFFCAVSLKTAPPEYVDKPAAVAHGTGTGSEIASCNYPARSFGVKNGMWMKKALELCPDIKVLPYDFPAYEEASGHFYDAILKVGGTVQSVSVDEAFVDVSSIVIAAGVSDGVGSSEGSLCKEQEKCDQIARELREHVKKRTGCNVSVGIGANILLARVALRKAKPAGQCQIKPEEVQDILDNLKVEQLPGVAYSLGGKLEELGVKSVKNLRQVSKGRLSTHLGPKTGERLWDYARGIDNAQVGDQPPRKSVSVDVSWGIRFTNQQEAEEFVHNLCHELERRLLNEHVKGTNLTMKIMRRASDAPLDPTKHLGHGKCDTFNKSVVFGVATHDARTIGKEAVSVLRSFKITPGDLRGFGVQLTRLEPIKSSSTTGVEPDGGQRRLPFGPAASGGGKKKRENIDDGGPQTIPSSRPPFHRQRPAAEIMDVEDDPIADDPLTPRKPKPKPVHPALALSKAAERDEKARTPLNISGTQFIMPANPDPAVLQELPPDILSRLLAQGGSSHSSKPGTKPSATIAAATAVATKRDPSPFALPGSRASKKTSSSNIRSRPASPVPGGSDSAAIPPYADPEVFAALPEDMKAEVLASYRSRTTTLPHSPRKGSKLQQSKRPTTPTKRPDSSSSAFGGGGGGIRDIFQRARERQQQQAFSNHSQNYEAAGPSNRPGSSNRSGSSGSFRDRTIPLDNTNNDAMEQPPEIEPPDPDFLAELPPSIRKEILEDHERRLRALSSAPAPAPPVLKHSSSSSTSAGTNAFLNPALNPDQEPGPSHSREPTSHNLNPENNPDNDTAEPQQPFLPFPPLPPLALPFTPTSTPTSTSQLKQMLLVWITSTLSHGPNTKDVLVLQEYLLRVGREERNAAKVVEVIRWVCWVVENEEGDKNRKDGGKGKGDKGKRKWKEAVTDIKEGMWHGLGRQLQF